METRRTIHIDAPPERVWSVMSDVERWHEWTASISKVELLDGSELRASSRARVTQPKLPQAVWQVTQLDPGRYFEWENRSPGLRSVGGHGVEPDGDGTLATLWIRQTGLMTPILALFYKKLINRYVQMEADGLKQRSEATA